MSGTIAHLLVIVLCLLGERAKALRCYPDYCLNTTNLVPTSDFQCLLTRVQRGKDCTKLKFEDSDDELFKRDDSAVFTLRAYVQNLEAENEKATAFNLSVSDINFDRLITRYRHIVNEDANACRQINLYGNFSHPAPKSLYVSCPFADSAYEGMPYLFQYLTTNGNHAYTRKYVFHVPQHTLIQDGVDIKFFTPFIYVDVSDSAKLVLYVQQLPPSYNVTTYRMWLVRNGTDLSISTVLSAHRDGRHIQHNFTAPDGIYYVKVAALHPKCGERGCANSTSPYIHIKQVTDRLLIMIISLIWIPPVLLYAVYQGFKLYKKKVLKRMSRRLNCLLVYSPTHVAHVKVMEELTRYLQCCNINAMIDIFNIRDIASQDPGIWCNMAFLAADVVLVVSSPPPMKTTFPNVYRNVDQHLLRLLKENYPQRNKRYYAVQLPYCKLDDVPQEARLFKRFRLPEDLKKLVKTIHSIGCFRFRSSTDKELLYNIHLTTKILEEAEISGKKCSEETEDLLPSLVTTQDTTNHDDLGSDLSNHVQKPEETLNDDVIPQSFTTRINELNLLGEKEDGSELAKTFYSAKNDCDFRIDKLNL